MKVIKLPSNNLIIPLLASSDGDDVIGDGVEEITPSHPQYAIWLPFAVDDEDAN